MADVLNSHPASGAEAPWRAGLRGARANLLPGFVLQAVALARVLAYYHHTPTREALAGFTAWRVELGVWSAVITTGLAGGLLPALYMKLHRATRARTSWALVAFFTLFWAYKGIEVDLWYRCLAWMVGEGNDARTVLMKGFLDQFVYCPFFAVPLSWAAYTWAQEGFSGRRLRARFAPRGWYAREVMPMLISNLGVWVPAVLIIYALPTPLQLPLQNVVLCFFTLLLAHLAREQRR